MTVVVITPPTPVVTVDDMERHLADLPDEDREYVELLIAAATAWIDGPAGWLGRSIGVQELEDRGWFACERYRLPYGPVIEVEGIVVEGEDGSDETVDPLTYSLRHGDLVVAPGSSWVTRPNHRIRYWAGYGKRDSVDATKWINEAPAPIKVAIMMLVAQWYALPEGVTVGSAVSEMPFAVEALLQPYRVYA